MKGRKSKLKRLPASAMPLGALYACEDCPKEKQMFDAVRAAWHRKNTGHRLTLVMEIS